MPNSRIYRPTRTDADQVQYIRELIEASCVVLRRPVADTFLGRKTQEPFTQEDELSPPEVGEVTFTFPLRDAGS